MDEENKKSEVAVKRPRDKHGHFIKLEDLPKPVEHFVKNKVNVSQGHDDEKLIGLKVNNPLQKITDLLEDIKRQKAFQFTLKGSLGIMGVALSLSILGLFGTTHMLCDKGVQTQFGLVKVLQATEDEEPIALWAKIKKAGVYFQSFIMDTPIIEETPKQRVVLFTAAKTGIQLLGIKEAQLKTLINQPVFATGKYDSCSQKLQITKPQNVELSQ